MYLSYPFPWCRFLHGVHSLGVTVFVFPFFPDRVYGVGGRSVEGLPTLHPTRGYLLDPSKKKRVRKKYTPY